MDEETVFTSERRRMVEYQLAGRDIVDPQVLEAMRSVPRHLFVPLDYRHLAYTDGPLPIGKGQTISQPYIVALMTQLMQLKGSDTVLEIGTGSGYQAAILATLACQVHTIERHADLARLAARVLKDLGLNNVTIHVGDGSLGLPEFAPYAAITVTAAAPWVPQALLDQLAGGGRLVIPVGSRGDQTLQCWFRQGGKFSSRSITPVAFVPLVGEQGWKE